MGTVINPFNPKQPVENLEDFFGRKSIILKITKGVLESKSFAVIGGRKIGKTSLLNILIKHFLSIDSEIKVIPLKLDLQEFTPKSRSSFFNYLNKKICEYLQKIQKIEMEVNKIKILQMSEEDFDLEVALNNLEYFKSLFIKNFNCVKLICLIDELEYLQDKSFTDDLLSNLRVIINNHPIRSFISFIFFGNRFLHEMTNMRGSPLDNIMTIIQLTALEKDEALELVYSNLPPSLEKKYAIYICERGGFHPFLLKYILSLIWEERKNKEIDFNEINMSCEAVLKESKVFHYWFNELRDLDKKIYYELAKKVNGEYVVLSIKDLLLCCKSDFLEDAIDRLFYHGFIKKIHSDRYMIVPSIFMDYFFNNYFIKDNVFSFNLDEYNRLLGVVKMNYSKKENKQKGDSLEYLAKFLIESCDNLKVELKKNTSIGEIDLLVTNKNKKHHILSKVGNFICECKNWSEKVGVQEIQVFRKRMEDFETILGIYFSKLGITGKVSSAAKKQVYDLYKEKKYWLVVINLRDLEEIGKGKDFLTMLEEKIKNIRFQSV